MEVHPLRVLRNINRSREIATSLAKFGFGLYLERLRLGRYLRWGRRLFFRRSTEVIYESKRGERLRQMLEELGATFIKFGQLLSTRPDLVPSDIIEELSKLQENVPAFPSTIARALLEKQLGDKFSNCIVEFSETPLAAGSLAQVHIGQLRDGRKVALKIRRPNVVQEVERDLSLMLEFATLTERLLPEWRIFNPIGVVQHFTRTIRRELNFAREGRTIEEFARLFQQDASLYVPRVYSELTSEGVLTLEYIEGYRLSQQEKFRQAGIPPQQIAANGARIFLKQAFELGVFHGDPHPGNIRIMYDGSICLLDFGMVGYLEDERREELIDLLLSINSKDANRTVDIIRKLGECEQPEDLPLLRADVRDFVECYYGVPLEQIKVGMLLSDFVKILSRHGIHFPSNLMLLLRALITLEGVGRELDPQFNLASHLAPFIEHHVRDRYTFNHLRQKMMTEGRQFLRMAHSFPFHFARSLEKLSKDDLRINLEHQGIDHLITEIDRSSNRLVIGLVLSAMIVASALIIRSGVESFWFSIPIYLLSSFLGIWLVYGIFRSGRL